MKNCRELIATTAAAALIGLSLSARADVSMTLIDAGSYAQANVFALYNSAHQNIISGLDVGVYEFRVNGNQNVWGVCISPGGYVDSNAHNYSVQTFDKVLALNSPDITLAGLQTAGRIMNTWEADALAGGRDAAMGFTAAIYSVLFKTCTVEWLSTTDQAVKDAFAKYTSGLQGTYDGYVYSPNPATSGQNHDIYGNYYGQQFLVPVPEPSTVLAGIGALGFVLLGLGRQWGVFKIGK